MSSKTQPETVEDESESLGGRIIDAIVSRADISDEDPTDKAVTPEEPDTSIDELYEVLKEKEAVKTLGPGGYEALPLSLWSPGPPKSGVTNLEDRRIKEGGKAAQEIKQLEEDYDAEVVRENYLEDTGREEYRIRLCDGMILTYRDPREDDELPDNSTDSAEEESDWKYSLEDLE